MMRVELLDADEAWPLVEALDRAVYPPEYMAGVIWKDIVWAKADKRVVAWDGGDVVAHVGMFFRDGTHDGERSRMCGIGGVMTATSARKRGFASAAMARAAQAMEGADFGLLFCEQHNVKLYAGLGWQLFAGQVHCAQPSGPFIFNIMPNMVLPLRTAPRDGKIDLCGLPW